MISKKFLRMRCLDSITDSMDMNLRKFWEIVKNRGVWCPTVQEIRESDTAWQLNNSREHMPTDPAINVHKNV